MKPISFICNVQKTIKCFGGGAGSGGSQTQAGPWEGQQGYLSDVFNQAQSQYNNYTPQYYGYDNGSQTGGSTVQPFNQQETSAIGQIGDMGANGTAGLNSADSALQNYTDGSMLSAGNPYFQNVADQTAASVTPELMKSFTQGTTDNPNVALAASNGVANAVGNLAYGNYNQQSQNQLNAANQANSLYNTQLGGVNAALTAGQTQQTQDQSQLQNQVDAYNYYQQLPYTKLNQYTNTVNGQYGQSTTQTSPAQSFFQTLFQGNASDRNLKENIRRVGTADNGLPIYIFTYKSDNTGTYHMGVMAQEVEVLHPDAVMEFAEGKHVNYERALS